MKNIKHGHQICITHGQALKTFKSDPHLVNTNRHATTNKNSLLAQIKHKQAIYFKSFCSDDYRGKVCWFTLCFVIVIEKSCLNDIFHKLSIDFQH